jgi:hypothetical protein
MQGYAKTLMFSEVYKNLFCHFSSTPAATTSEKVLQPACLKHLLF